MKNEEEEEKVDVRRQKKPEWDEELLYKLLEEVGDTENDEGEEEDNP